MIAHARMFVSGLESGELQSMAYGCELPYAQTGAVIKHTRCSFVSSVEGILCRRSAVVRTRGGEGRPDPAVPEHPLSIGADYPGR